MPVRTLRFPLLVVAALSAGAILAPSGSTSRPNTIRAVVGFHSNEELASALSDFPGAKIVRRLPHMKTVEVCKEGTVGGPGVRIEERERIAPPR